MKTSIYAQWLTLIFSTIFGINAFSQSPYQANFPLRINHLAVYGGDLSASLTDSLNYGVYVNQGTIMGKTGSNTFVYTDGTGNYVGDVFANIFTSTDAGNVILSSNLYAFNRTSREYPVVRTQGGANFRKIYSNGGIDITSGIVSDSVVYSASAINVPGGTSTFAYPGVNFSPMPLFPAPTQATAGAADITTTQVLIPGNYNNLTLTGGQEITFQGAGLYVFNSINLTGDNVFNYDLGDAIKTGSIKVVVLGKAALDRLTTFTVGINTTSNNIYWEVQGTETNAFEYNTTAPVIENNYNFFGTVYTPNGGIVVGSLFPSSSSFMKGCLWSKKRVSISRTNVAGSPPNLTSLVSISPNSNILPYYPPPYSGKVSEIYGSELTSLLEHPSQFANDSIIYRIDGNEVYIDAIVQLGQEAAALAYLQSLGFNSQISNGTNSLILTGKIPIDKIAYLNTAEYFNYVRPLFYPILNNGLAQTQGDSSMLTGVVRRGYDLTGQGTKIGVMSDSYNAQTNDYAAIDIANGDLPGNGTPYAFSTPVQTVKEYSLGPSIDEGRAMLQIVHDVAPGAALAFRTGYLTAGDMAIGIGQLKDAGCNVIVDDLTYITEPFYKDGVIAKAANAAVENGVTYFTSAGNFGKKSFQGTFNGVMYSEFPSYDLSFAPNYIHDFGGGNPFQELSLAPGNYTIVLQWDDDIYSQFGNAGTTADMDIYLMDEFNNPLFGFNRYNGGNDPLEVLPFKVLGAEGDLVKAKLLFASNDIIAKPFKYIIFRGQGTIPGYTGSSTIVGQANAESVITVGAVLYSNTPPYENAPSIASFSSQGGTTTMDDMASTTRNKPDVIAPNGVNTTVDFGSVDLDGNGIPNFFGTSASAPHAAAAAALLREGKQKYLGQDLSPAEMKNLMQSTATDMDAPGFDFKTGYGMLQPLAAMMTFAAPKPEIVELLPHLTGLPTATFTASIRGLGLTPNTKVYFNGSQMASTYVSNKLVKAEIPVFTGNPALKLYNPPIVSTGSDGGFSEPKYFFSEKPEIVITAENKQNRYGEKLPTFTSTITIGGQPADPNSQLFADLGLNNIQYSTTATSGSVVALYPIVPALANPISQTQTDLRSNYNWKMNNGVLNIQKMPLKITPLNKTLTYGDKIENFEYSYILGGTEGVASVQNMDSLKTALNLAYKGDQIPNLYALIEGHGATSTALVNEDVEGLAMLISNGSGARSTALVNEGVVSNVVYLVEQNVLDYGLRNGSGARSTALVNGSGARSTALVNADALANGTATIENGHGATSTALVNGSNGYVNSNNTNATSNSLVAILVNDDDVPVNSTTATIQIMGPVNMVTGITAGTHFIVPAAFISANYAISYGAGTLTINPATLTVKANSVTTTNPVLPTFTSVISGFKYQDAALPQTGPTYSLSPAYSGTPGTYSINPAGLSFAAASNYHIVYQPGTFTLTSPCNTTNPIAQKIVIGLRCVERNTGADKNLYTHIAHFTYTNNNCYAVTIPIGANNLVTSQRAWRGTVPTTFLPGTHIVDIYFSAAKVTWSVTSRNGNGSRTATSCFTAGQCSRNCSSLGRSPDPMQPEVEPGLNVYPNPATTTISLSYPTIENAKNIRLIDGLGKMYNANIVGKGTNYIRIDVSRLSSGVYIILVDNKKTTTFIKL